MHTLRRSIVVFLIAGGSGCVVSGDVGRRAVLTSRNLVLGVLEFIINPVPASPNPSEAHGQEAG
jgi:hypothetical protein